MTPEKENECLHSHILELEQQNYKLREAYRIASMAIESLQQKRDESAQEIVDLGNVIKGLQEATRFWQDKAEKLAAKEGK